MFDIYADDVSLMGIRVVKNQQELIFKNTEKDETLHIPISNKEMLNMLHRLRMRCETLGLIYPVNIKECEEE